MGTDSPYVEWTRGGIALTAAFVGGATILGAYLGSHSDYPIPSRDGVTQLLNDLDPDDTCQDVPNAEVTEGSLETLRSSDIGRQVVHVAFQECQRGTNAEYQRVVVTITDPAGDYTLTDRVQDGYELVDPDWYEDAIGTVNFAGRDRLADDFEASVSIGGVDNRPDFMESYGGKLAGGLVGLAATSILTMFVADGIFRDEYGRRRRRD